MDNHAYQQLPLFTLFKRCPRCIPPTEKPIEEFYKDHSSTDGHGCYCKVCTRAYVNTARQANPEQARENDRKRVRDLAKMRSYGQKCYNKHRIRRTAEMREQYNSDADIRARKLDYCHEYQTVHVEHKRVKGREYYATHKLEAKEKDMRRNARKRQTATEKVSYEVILERDGAWCHICEQAILPHQKLEFDHVIPISRGGPHIESNIKPSHRECNRRKWDKFMEDLTEWDRQGPKC